MKTKDEKNSNITIKTFEKIGKKILNDEKSVGLEFKDKILCFIIEVNKIHNCPPEVAHEFFKKYGENGELTPREACEKFLRSIEKED